jgi:hypothetical protein
MSDVDVSGNYDVMCVTYTDRKVACVGASEDRFTAIRARVPLKIVRDTIQPFPSFSDIVAAAVKTLRRTIAAATPVDPVASVGGSR